MDLHLYPHLGLRTVATASLCVGLVLCTWEMGGSDAVGQCIFPEQRRMQIRPPSRLPKVQLPAMPPPPTVSPTQQQIVPRHVSLDDAIRAAIGDSEVVRVLAGNIAVASGRTIYDPAIANTAIDRARARFDPTLRLDNRFSRARPPGAALLGGNPPGTILGGDSTQAYDLTMGLAKTTMSGGTAGLDVGAGRALTRSGQYLPLNPRADSTVDLSFTQPLLQGAGRRANMVPIVLARIDTERSYFQMKDAVQRMVLGVVEAYWALVSARIDEQSREQQVISAERALDYLQTRKNAGMQGVSESDVAQARSSLASFRAALVGARATQLRREAALRSIMGLPPSDGHELIPVTPFATGRPEVDWDGLVALAEEQRPDLIELKLIVEAGRQLLMAKRNQALPQVDATALYQWNGLEGRTPDRQYLHTRPGEYAGWALGVNFSVPLGMRQSRAELRQQELVLMRDRANLREGLHEATHILAASYRDLAQYYAQYEAFGVARQEAERTFDAVRRGYEAGLSIVYLNYLQASTDWFNAASSEGQTLAQYNLALADLEYQTGTILESHGIRFQEERFGSIGPLGRLADDECYPKAYRPTDNEDRYPRSSEPSEAPLMRNVPFKPLQSPGPNAPLPRLP